MGLIEAQEIKRREMFFTLIKPTSEWLFMNRALSQSVSI